MTPLPATHARRQRRSAHPHPLERATPGAAALVRRPAGLVAAAVLVVLAGCSGSDDKADPAAATQAAPACPVEAVTVAVTVAPWADVVARLGGQCTTITTIVGATTGDPHDFEPTPADQAALGQAKVVVMNGLGYDRWAEKALEAAADKPIVVDAGKVTSKPDGANPHLWYGGGDVAAVAGAVTSALVQARPEAKAYFDQRQAAFLEASNPYTSLIGQMSERHIAKRYAATEAIADGLATELGIVNATPEGYARAIANESEPSPGDLADFRRLLAERQVAVLVANPQTEGSIPAELRTAAEAAGVPVVEMTETAPAGTTSFFDWQIAQLRKLDEALSSTR